MEPSKHMKQRVWLKIPEKFAYLKTRCDKYTANVNWLKSIFIKPASNNCCSVHSVQLLIERIDMLYKRRFLHLNNNAL